MPATLVILLAITFGGSEAVDSRSGQDSDATAAPTVRQAGTPPDDSLPGRLGPPGAQIIIRERIIIRVPSQRIPAERALSPADREPSGKERRCIPVAAIRSAMPAGERALMIDLGGRGRYWAALGRGCRSMDFHGGIYIAPASDGRFCIDRDILRARSGANCAVSRLVDLP